MSSRSVFRHPWVWFSATVDINLLPLFTIHFPIVILHLSVIVSTSRSPVSIYSASLGLTLGSSISSKASNFTWYQSKQPDPTTCLGPVSIANKTSHFKILSSLESQDLYLELYYCSQISQAHRQLCWRCACQISKWCYNLNYQSRSFGASRDLMIRLLIGHWNRALSISSQSRQLWLYWVKRFLLNIFLMQDLGTSCRTCKAFL